jgi:hypothetical protein
MRAVSRNYSKSELLSSRKGFNNSYFSEIICSSRVVMYIDGHNLYKKMPNLFCYSYLWNEEIFIRAKLEILESTSIKSILFPVSFHRFIVFDIRCSITCLAFFSSLKYRKAVLIWHLTFLATVPVEIERIDKTSKNLHNSNFRFAGIFIKSGAGNRLTTLALVIYYKRIYI